MSIAGGHVVLKEIVVFLINGRIKACLVRKNFYKLFFFLNMDTWKCAVIQIKTSASLQAFMA